MAAWRAAELQMSRYTHIHSLWQTYTTHECMERKFANACVHNGFIQSGRRTRRSEQPHNHISGSIYAARFPFLHETLIQSILLNMLPGLFLNVQTVCCSSGLGGRPTGVGWKRWAPSQTAGLNQILKSNPIPIFPFNVSSAVIAGLLNDHWLQQTFRMTNAGHKNALRACETEYMSV